MLLSNVANAGTGVWMSYWSGLEEKNSSANSLVGVAVFTSIGASQGNSLIYNLF